MKRKIIALLLSLALVLVMFGVAEATTVTRQITADYQDIKLYVNGNAVSVQANEEPFIYNGRTFVPIRVVAEALNQNVEWVDLLKSVKISGQNNAGTTDLNTLAQKDKEIQYLKLQLAQKDSEIQSLKNTVASLQEDDDSDDVINDLEDDLISDYDSLDDVEIGDISLDGDEDDVYVDIEVDLDDYGDEWAVLDDSDIEDWLEDMVGSIQDELSDDTGVNGEIIDTDSNDVLVEFCKDGDDDLDVEFNDEDYREDSDDVENVVDSLEGYSYYVKNIEFTITDIDYDDDDSVTVTLDAADDDASSEWEDLDSSTINNDVMEICEDIAGTFADDADISLDAVALYFYDEDQDLLDNFDYDVDNGELD